MRVADEPVITTPNADLQILELDGWWRGHRDKAPDLFELELAQAFELISSAPGAGKRHAHPRDQVRRVMLPRTRNHVYYVEYEDHVVVVAVWGAVSWARARRTRGSSIMPMNRSWISTP